jgi:hypothetical protein
LAYTAGNDMAFGTGRYAPGTTAGRELVAHELAHVVQATNDGDAIVRRRKKKPSGEPEPLFRFEGCEREYRGAILDAYRDAVSWLDKVILELSGLDRDDRSTLTMRALLAHFCTTAPEEIAIIRANFRKIRDEFDISIRFECEEGCGADTSAFVRRKYGIFRGPVEPIIHFCPAFFDDLTEKYQIVVIIHEFAHKGLDRGRHPAPFEDKDYPGNREKAIRNPDSYALFAKDIFYGRVDYRLQRKEPKC